MNPYHGEDERSGVKAPLASANKPKIREVGFGLLRAYTNYIVLR
jgi:hypothetical protein